MPDLSIGDSDSFIGFEKRIFLLHTNVQLPVLTLIRAILWEATNTNLQRWITSH